MPILSQLTEDSRKDRMTYLDDPDSGMSSVTVEKGGLVVIRVGNASSLKKRCTEQCLAGPFLRIEVSYSTFVAIHQMVPPASLMPPRLSSSCFLTGSCTETAP